jgi:hypothetical protein
VQGDAPPDSSTSSSGSGGAGGGCATDCSKIETPPCYEAVCNTGQVAGPLNICTIVASPKGTTCDDGKFCTTDDACDNGVCVGGTKNDCGAPHNPCAAVICYESSKTCQVTPVDDGTACTPTDVCKTDGVCQLGQCVGQPKDCTFSPLNECNTVTCDPSDGKCKGTPDPDKNNTVCILTGDACHENKTCQSGDCVGGAKKDCSSLDADCQVGVCDSATGLCGPAHAPVGASCTGGIDECLVGKCDAKGDCKASAGPNGVTCNDHDSCTTGEQCSAGACVGGSAVPGCVLYLQEGFETCPDGWTLSGDWQCGTPVNVGPSAAHGGKHVIATQIGGVYHINQGYNTCTADSPTVNLTTATNPMLSFWVWDWTEGGSYDGWNLKVSTNGGTSFTEVMTVDPAYQLMSVGGQKAWGGDFSAEGWQNYTADLSAYAGQSIILRFAFHSDSATVYPGVYIDDVVVAEPLEIPLYITTTSPLPDAYEGVESSAQITKVGGTSGSVWSINPGGINTGWLSIDNTGLLTGVPTVADLGPVKVTIHVEEPGLPSNFADQTFTFTVQPDVYYTSFEGTCPDGWALTGDWQCGVPINVGPATAFVGQQCLGTQIGANYSALDTWANTTATSPDIDLTGVPSPTLTFKMWVDTEGTTRDGANLEISTDGGMTYSVVTTLMPVYPLMIAGEPAWGGHEATLGWQPVQVDLSAYANQTIRLRFAFQSDDAGEFAGVYIDDFWVN